MDSEKESALAESQVDTLLGSVIDSRFELVRLLGNGATSAVYLAHQKDMDRHVAIKLLRPLKSTVDIERLRREARLTGELKHPNIVEIYATGISADQYPYFVMQYIEGVSLKSLIQQQGKLTMAHMLTISEQCCAALASAHQRGIIHRDLKPANILISFRDGQPEAKIIDFGLSKFIDTQLDAKLTATGVITGTPAYMSPEQCRGEPLDSRSDLYSLGCVMYEMLSGHPPFDSDNIYALMAKHDADTPPPLKEQVSHVPPYVEAALFKLLRKDKEKRFASAEQLKEFLITQGSAFRTKSLPVFKTRYGATKLAISMLTLTGVLAFAALGYFNQQQQPVAQITPQSQQTWQKRKHEAELHHSQGKLLLDLGLRTSAKEQLKQAMAIYKEHLIPPDTAAENDFYLISISWIRAIAQEPDATDLHERLQRVENQRKKDKKIIPNDDLKDAQVLNARGYVHLAEQQARQAREDFAAAAKLTSPGSSGRVRTLLNLALADQKLGDSANAERSLKSALSEMSLITEPKERWSAGPTAEIAYGEFLARHGRCAEAISLLRNCRDEIGRYAQLDSPNWAVASIKCARALRVCGAETDAVGILNSVRDHMTMLLKSDLPDAIVYQGAVQVANQELAKRPK